MLGRSGTPRARVHCWSPNKTGKFKSKFCGSPLFWCLFWKHSCLFLGIKAALDTLPDLAADRLPRGWRPPSKQHFRSIALVLLHSPRNCRISPFQTSFQPNCGLAEKNGKDTNGALSLSRPRTDPWRVGNCQPPWNRARNDPFEGKMRPFLRFLSLQIAGERSEAYWASWLSKPPYAPGVHGVKGGHLSFCVFSGTMMNLGVIRYSLHAVVRHQIHIYREIRARSPRH